MKSFLREYAVRSIRPLLHSYTPSADVLFAENAGNYPQNHYNHNDDTLINASSDDSLYFISGQQQLLNGSDYYASNESFDNGGNETASASSLREVIATTIEAITIVESVLYNESSNGFNGNSRPTPTILNTEIKINETVLYDGYGQYYNFSCDGESQSSSGNSTIEDESALSSVYFKTAVYVLYIPIFIFALLGNGTVCYIVQSTPRMRTVTNYFISNLAVGDILMSLFCVPFSFVSIFILGYWPFGIALCYLVNYSQAVSVLVSAYTLVAISIDRFMAIMWPLRPRITKRYAKILIAGVWGIALMTAFPIPIVSKLTQPDIWHVQCDRYICREVWPSNEQYYYYTWALFTLQFIIPLSVLVFTYTRIALAVWGKRPPGEAENSRDQRMARSKRKMIKMMVTVVIVFTICWLPFNILVLLLNDDEFKYWEPLPYFWFAFHWLAMSHSCYNPIIYCYMNARFRGGFLQIIYRVPGLRRCCCLRHYLRNRGDRSYEATGEMTFKFIADNGGGGLLRQPKIRIRDRRCIPPAASQHMHHIHKHKAKTPSKFHASESIFVCGNHSVAVVPASQPAVNKPYDDIETK